MSLSGVIAYRDVRTPSIPRGKIGAFPLIAVVAIQACANALLGQNPVVVGEVLNFRSAILAEDRQVFIAKPADYDGAAETYPVLYILDAETHFRYASGLVEFLAFADRIPEMI